MKINYLPLQKKIKMSKKQAPKHINGKILSKQDIENLLLKARDFIAEGEYEEAEEIAEKLIHQEVQEGYDLMAIIYAASERFEEAIEILNEAVAKYPKDSYLWTGLGNCLAEVEQYEEAMNAYNTALSCADDDKLLIELNIAVLYGRQGMFEKTFEMCEKNKDSELKNEFASVLLTAYIESEKYDDAITFEKKELSKLNPPEDPDFDDDLSLIYALIAKAHLRKNGDKKHIEKLIRKAIDFDRTNEEALLVWREFNNLPANKSKYFRVEVQGEFKIEDDEPAIFTTDYELVADNIKEALEIIRAYEVKEVISIDIVESDSETTNEKLKGLYVVSDLLFDDEFDDEDF